MCIEAYAAGLFDGEGCVFINRTYRWSTDTPSYQLTASMGMNDRVGLDAVSERFGGNVRGPDKRGTYQWALSGNGALSFLATIEPYCRVKGPQIDVTKSYTVTDRTPYSVDYCERERIRAELQALNAPKSKLGRCSV